MHGKGENVKIGLRMEDALCRSKWSVGLDNIAAGLKWIWPPSLVGDTGILDTLANYGLRAKSDPLSYCILPADITNIMS